MNLLHSSIKFTMEINKTKLPFLDILVQLNEGIISTDIYSKPTDTKNYLNFNSCHPKHTKINIPFNLASRIVTIVSDTDLRKQRLQELTVHLKQLKYPETLIKHGILRAEEKGPILSINDSKKKVDNIIPFVTTYNPNDTNVFNAINIHKHILHKSEKMNKILQKHKIINCKRQAKNLKRRLCAPKFELKKQNKKVSKGGTTRCATCKIIQVGQSFKFKNGKLFS